MREFRTKAYAKINLGLDVVRKREDGYHDLRMVMQTINLFDDIYMKSIKRDEIIIKTDKAYLPTNENNIAYKAAKLIKDTYGIEEGVFINIKKRIPVAAGMAGGSSDGAAVLVGMNKIFELNLSMETLMEYGARLGADIPYCIMRGTALAEGIGEKLTRIAPMPHCYVLTIKPDVYVSTKEVYQSLVLDESIEHPDIDGIVEDLKNENLQGICAKLGNVLESVTAKKYPIIEEYKKKMVEYGAANALMSGSGPSVFGIFESKEAASQAKIRLMESMPAGQINVSRMFNVSNI